MNEHNNAFCQNKEFTWFSTSTQTTLVPKTLHNFSVLPSLFSLQITVNVPLRQSMENTAEGLEGVI